MGASSGWIALCIGVTLFSRHVVSKDNVVLPPWVLMLACAAGCELRTVYEHKCDDIQPDISHHPPRHHGHVRCTNPRNHGGPADSAACRCGHHTGIPGVAALPDMPHAPRGSPGHDGALVGWPMMVIGCTQPNDFTPHQMFNPALGVPLPERNYASDCALLDNAWHVRWDVLQGIFDICAVGHVLGWLCKALVVRSPGVVCGVGWLIRFHLLSWHNETSLLCKHSCTGDHVVCFRRFGTQPAAQVAQFPRVLVGQVVRVVVHCSGG